MPILNRLPISPCNDDDLYKALVKRPAKIDHDTPRNYAFILIGSAVAVQWVDGGPCTQGTVVGKGYHNQNNRSYTICITKAGLLKTRNSKHIKTIQITAKQYPRDKLEKQRRTITVQYILKHFKEKTEQNIMYTINVLLNKVTTGKSINDTQWDNMQQDLQWY